MDKKSNVHLLIYSKLQGSSVKRQIFRMSSEHKGITYQKINEVFIIFLLKKIKMEALLIGSRYNELKKQTKQEENRQQSNTKVSHMFPL